MEKRILVSMINLVLSMLICFANIHASEVKLVASDGKAEDQFGECAHIHGDYAIVGASYRDDCKGVAYIFKRDGSVWREQARLFADDGAKEDYFGSSVAISEDYAFVGAPYDDDRGVDTGSVYIFHHTGESWIQQAKLNPHGATILWCNFGINVAISGGYLIVGSWQESGAGGAVYIFKHVDGKWEEQAKLVSSDWAQFDRFGNSVDISGDYAIATAPYHTEKKGSAYIFKREGDTWKEQAVLTANDGEADDWFGISASISGDYAIVGANGDKMGGVWTGAAYIFKRDGDIWSQHAKLIPDDITQEDYFGSRVCISGNYAIVSSIWDDDKGTNSGSIYGFLWDGNSWSQVSKQTASDGVDGDRFGASVDISGDHVIVGAREADANGFNSGSAYIYSCAEDLSFPSFPVELSDFTATTFAGEKNRYRISDEAVLPPAEAVQAIPRKSRLLQNFPNPFNPDTWLPYELASDAIVTIHIYDVKGQLVREMNLGRQEAGSYVTKDKAVYWDGKNEVGESVASGVHIYWIEADDWFQARKMTLVR